LAKRELSMSRAKASQRYLEVLYNEQELFTAELNLAQARLNELLSVIELYRALGGGWQQEVAKLSANRVP
jgi:outer membrane protein TolC